MEVINVNNTNKDHVFIDIEMVETHYTEETLMCCICLDSLKEPSKEPDEIIAINDVDIKFKCCENRIHKKCLFEILLSKKDILDNLNDFCPLCRSEFSFKNFFTLSDINLYFQHFVEYKINERILNERRYGIDTDIIIRDDDENMTLANSIFIKEHKKTAFIINKYYKNKKKKRKEPLISLTSNVAHGEHTSVGQQNTNTNISQTSTNRQIFYEFTKKYKTLMFTLLLISIIIVVIMVVSYK
jgi:hypothetical protein